MLSIYYQTERDFGSDRGPGTPVDQGSERKQSLNDNEYTERFSPDGLTEQMIDVLLREIDGAAVAKPRPSSTLMDGTAAQRRYRREARRSVAAVVRALPRSGALSGPDGWAA